MFRCFGYAFPNLWRSLVQPRFPLLQNRPHRTHPSHPSIHPWCFHESSRDLAGQDHPSLFWNYGSANASHSECSAKPSPERMVSGFLHVNDCQTAVRLFDPSLVPLFDRWFLEVSIVVLWMGQTLGRTHLGHHKKRHFLTISYNCRDVKSFTNLCYLFRKIPLMG